MSVASRGLRDGLKGPRSSTVVTVMALVTCLAHPNLSNASDGIIEINQACAEAGCFEGDLPGFPVRIAAAGSYRLTSNLVRTPASSELIIASEPGEVAIDLNGFTVDGPIQARTLSNGTINGHGGTIQACYIDNIKTSGPSTVYMGRFASDPQGQPIFEPGCKLTNSFIGGVRGSSGICVRAGERAYIENNHVTTCEDAYGIRVDQFSLVRGNRVWATGVGIRAVKSLIEGNVVVDSRNGACGPSTPVNHGIVASESVVRGNIVSDNCGTGIVCDFCNVQDNVANNNGRFGNGGVGFQDASGTSGYSGNQFNNNNGGNANPQVSGGIDLGGNVCGGDTTCP